MGGCGHVVCARTTPRAVRTGISQAFSVLRVQHCASASGQHQPSFGGQFLQHLGLPAAKAGLALNLEDQRNAYTGARLDFMVAIDKALLQAPRQLPADRRLARAHHAHKVDILAGFHMLILSGEWHPKKERAG